MGIVSFAAKSLVALAALAPAGVLADKPLHTDLASYQKGDYGEKPVQSFESSPLKAALWQVNKFDVEKIDTDDAPFMFLTGRYGRGWGPSIVSSKDLSLVWADQHYDGLAQTTRVWENWKGYDRVMTVYSGGAVRIYSQEYELIYSVGPKGTLNGVIPDSHEAMLTDDGTVLMVVCPGREVDLTNVGGPATGKRVSDCHVQEVDPDTDEVLFQFNTLDFFKPEDSVMQYEGEDTWDFCHMNAVQKTPDGNFLISYRHLSTVILVDGKTAEVRWAMWGKKNMFTDVTQGGSAQFHFQHEPRITGDRRFTLFDNHRLSNGYCKNGPCSRGLEVEYDERNMTVKMVNQWYHPQELVSASRGGVQRLPSGNVVVAWGQNPMYTEYTSEGELAMDIQRGQVLPLEHGIYDVIAYRVWKDKWVGKPKWDPSIACTSSKAGKFIHVSWNGATEVDSWVLLASDNTTELNGPSKVVATLPRMGFETTFTLQDTRAFARVAALDKDGNIIGSTAAVHVEEEKVFRLDYKVHEVFEHEEEITLPPPEPTQEDVEAVEDVEAAEPVHDNDVEDEVEGHEDEHDEDDEHDDKQHNDDDHDEHDDDEDEEGDVAAVQSGGEDDHDEGDHSSALVIAGLAIAGACLGMSIAIVLFSRRRRSDWSSGESDASYGLLNPEAAELERNSSFQDDQEEPEMSHRR